MSVVEYSRMMLMVHYSCMGTLTSCTLLFLSANSGYRTQYSATLYMQYIWDRLSWGAGLFVSTYIKWLSVLESCAVGRHATMLFEKLTSKLQNPHCNLYYMLVKYKYLSENIIFLYMHFGCLYN